MKGKPKKKPMSRPAKVLLWILAFFVGLYLMCGCMIFLLRQWDPPITAVQIQRQITAAWDKHPYRARQLTVPMSRIAPDLQYAVIAAEDGRFYVHHGFDWIEMRKVVNSDLAKHSLGRGASTITQQLAKNLFLGTERSVIKKGVEFMIVPLIEWMLNKNRILELYLNQIEWGPGVYGAEAASEYWYHLPASELNRDQATRLAAIIPNPLRRNPARESEYAAEIDDRMKKMGW
jgi:monofunctional biosynthetic peptidoglycan transglycosylase